MKIIKKIVGILIGLVLILIAGMFACMLIPGASDTVANWIQKGKNLSVEMQIPEGLMNREDMEILSGYLIPEKTEDELAEEEQSGTEGSMDRETASENGSAQQDPPGTSTTVGSGGQNIPSSTATESGHQENATVYIAPDEDSLEIPSAVASLASYQPMTGKKTVVEEKEKEKLQKNLTKGDTGDGFDFDARMYPYYNMLDSAGQHLYRQIYANVNKNLYDFAPVESLGEEALKDVMSAYYNDHPESFWIDTAYGMKYTSDGTLIELVLGTNETAQNLGAAKSAFQSAAKKILDQVEEEDTPYEKEKKIHDALIKQVSYNKGAAMNQSAYSALVNGQSVCAGYARAYQYLLQQLDIPCYYCTGVAGENHAWNIVELEGDYYNVDSTWDDTNPNTHDYFNKTDREFFDDHMRKDLSVHLPPCNGTKYAEAEEKNKSEESSNQNVNLPTIGSTGTTSDHILYTMNDYFDDCYGWMLSIGKGNYEFQNIIVGETMLSQWYGAYSGSTYKQGFMDNVMDKIGATSCNLNMEINELQGNAYLITHHVSME